MSNKTRVNATVEIRNGDGAVVARGAKSLNADARLKNSAAVIKKYADGTRITITPQS